MPDVDNLMQEWPTQFEELLKEVFIINYFIRKLSFVFQTAVPPADIDVDLATYTDIACCM